MYCVLSYVSASVTSSLALICATSFEKIEVFCFFTVISNGYNNHLRVFLDIQSELRNSTPLWAILYSPWWTYFSLNGFAHSLLFPASHIHFRMHQLCLPALILHRASSPALWVPVSLSISLPAFTLHLPSVLNTVASAILCEDRSDHVTPLHEPCSGSAVCRIEPGVCPPSQRPRTSRPALDLSVCLFPLSLI